ncbi:MAG: 1-acyl-sn-glycerol-3-phosphate acyltransferase [Cyanobacteriota bacterium]|nr:1-acyl-sn-glycerol-3-phosphate acyltransferase [Cyanobacteriota bacterium]
MSRHTSMTPPPLNFLDPCLDPWVLRLCQGLAPHWLRWRRGIPEMQVTHLSTLWQHYQQFQAGKIRLILAFRHPSLDDAFCLMQALSHLASAHQQRMRLHRPVHAHFVYDRGIPLWAGAWVGWLLPRLAGIPIHRGKLDRQGLKVARQLLSEGEFPLAIAPEGTINGSSYWLNPLEPGCAQLALWGWEDGQALGREVVILPLGLSYGYQRDPLPALFRLLDDLEKECGLTGDRIRDRAGELDSKHVVVQRLRRVEDHLFQQVSHFYHNFYADWQADDTQPNESGTPLPQRWQALLHHALTTLESTWNLTHQGRLIERRHRLEQAIWDRLYQGIPPASPLARGLTHHLTAETRLHEWHLRWAESAMSLQSPQPEMSSDRLSEIALRLRDLTNRLQGKDPARTPLPFLGSRWAELYVGEPIAVSSYGSLYQRQRRLAVEQLTQQLQTQMEKLLPTARANWPEADNLSAKSCLPAHP